MYNLAIEVRSTVFAEDANLCQTGSGHENAT